MGTCAGSAWTERHVASERAARQAGLAEARGDRAKARALYAEAAASAEHALAALAACGPGLYAETLARAAWLWLRAGEHGRMFALAGTALASPVLLASVRSRLREALMGARPAGTMH